MKTADDRERAIQRLRNAAERFRRAKAEVASAEQEIVWAAMAFSQLEAGAADGEQCPEPNPTSRV